MADKKITLQFDAKMELSNIVSQLKVLQGQLEKMELPKDATKNFEKAFDKIGRDIAEFEIVAARGISSLADTKNVEKAWKQITKDLDGIGATLGSLDVSKVFPKEVLQNIEKANGALDKYLSKLESTRKSQEYTSKVDARDKAFDKQRVLQESLNKATQERTKKEANYVAKKSQWTDQIEQNYKNEQTVVAQTTKQLKDQIKVIESLEERKKELTKEGYLTSSGAVSATKRKEIAGLEDSGEKQKLTEAEDIGAQLSAAKNIKKDYEGMAKQAREAAKANQELKKSIEAAEAEFNSASKDADSFSTQLKQAEWEVDSLNTELKTLETDKAAEEWKELVALVKEITGIDLSGSVQDINKIQEALENYQTKEIEKIPQILKDAKQNFQDTAPAVKNVEQALRDTADEVKELSRAEQEIENLKNQIFQFFSVTNAIQLFKRTVQSAINTVKELDAVMTETAVVTEFSVGDMWEKLPEYASHANTLGASIKDLYSATTLYYQQGLQTEAAMSVGIETMKMARIAGMDAANATEAMTAALRGFNMEVNETNAVRVNDVYSELAAITAADTEQIATAMSKTASIASAANMEFETTAALLAQIIETTQEAPETAGTALKTIIARFSEVKKLREEGQMTGKDEEGEAIDVNKIQGALRTVGISMDDFFAGTEGLDSILLKLAEKWKDLDFETQRYIATTAAGSRQQSRFIAMMSDYERTMELATAANNSAGASQQQFDKTLESMEAKLQKLKNAWDEFAMGLANNEILKFGVDLLTGVLEVVNKLTNALSGGGGLVKSVISLMTVIGALKGGGMLLGKAESAGFFGKTFDKLKRQPINENSESQNRQKGERDGKAYIQSFNRAIEQGKKDGIKSGIKGFFGEQISMDKIISEEVFDDGELSSRISDKLMTAQYHQGIFELDRNGEDLTPYINQLSALQTELQEGKITAEEAKQKFAELGGDVSNIGTRTVETTETLKGFKVDLEGVGMAAVGVGTAFNLLGSLAEKLGLDGLSSALKGIGSVLTIVGSAAMALGPILTKLGVEFTTFGIKINGALVAPLSTILATIWPVVLALGALAAAIAIAYNASPEVQLKKAQEAAAQAGEAANAAAEAYDNLKSSLESIEGKEAVLEDLAVGTLEWKNAVSELNNEILDLVAKYPELSKFVNSTNGILSISDEGGQKLLENQLAVQQSAQAAKIGSQIKVQEAQQNVDFADLDYRLKLTKIIDTYDSYGNQIQQEVVDRQATEDLAMRLARGEISTNSVELDFLKDIEGGFEEFLEFGRALVASEEAIGVFTQSLMDAAIANAEIPQELKSQVQGAFDSEAVSNTMEESRIIGALTKADKEEYAKAMGYTHVSGRKYLDSQGNDIKISNAAVKQQLAAIRAQESLTGKFETLEGVLKKLSSSTNAIDKAFVNVTAKAGGAALTLEDLSSKEISGAFAKDYEGSIQTDEYGEFKGFENQHLQSLYEQVKDSYSPEDFFRIFSDAYGQATDRMAQANEKLSRIGLGDSFKNAKIDTGAFYDLADNLYDVFIASGQKKTTELSSMLESIFGKIEDPEQAQIFADAINSIDWKDVDSVKGLSDLLEGMGFNVPIGDIENLEDEIISAAKAAKNFSLEEVRNQLKSLGDLKKDLEDREDTDRTFTQEQRDAYIDMNADLVEDFVMVGPDEWVYIGDSMASLEAAIRENTSAILGETTGSLQEKAESSQKWIDLMNSEETYSGKQVSIQQHGINGELVISEAFTGTFEEVIAGVLNGTIKDQSLLKEVLTALGENTEGNITELVERISSLFSEQYGLNGSTANENVNNYENWKNTEYQQQLTQKAPTELIGMVQNVSQDDQNYEAIIKNNQQVISALEAQAKQLGITTEEIEYYKKALESTGKTGQELEAGAIAMATSMKKQQNAINEASKTIGGYLTELDDLEEGTVEYNSVLSKIPEQLEKAFGVRPSMDWLQVQENIDLVKEWAAGSEEAGTQIFNNLYGSIVNAMNGSEAEVANACSEMVSWLNWFSGTEVWASANLDNEGFMNVLTSSATAAEQFAAYLASQGFDAYLETSYQDVMMPVIGLDENTGDYGHIGNQILSIPTYTVRWEHTGNPNPFSGSGGFDAPNNYTPPSGGGGGGGGGGSSTEWENPYDEFYNTIQKLNEELRKRNKLEKEYQKLLDKINTSADDLTENSKKQLESLEAEKKTREGLLENRKKQMEDIESENSEYSEYAWYNEELGVIEIDWGKIEELDGSTDEEFTQGLEDFISQLEDQEKLIEEEIDALDDIYDETKKIREQGEEEYFSFEDRIKEALLDIRQDEIDKLNAINDSINDTNARLINAMQSSIDKYRQDRDNKKTEEDLADKQRRLAYLQQDTSGANALEIMQLQKEIEEGQEDYTDTLIDQKISELQEQNDKAAEQRERQIQIMEEQLKHYEESGEIWNDVYALMNEGVDSLGNLIEGSELEALLKTSEGFLGMSELEKVKWLEDLENEVAEGFKWLRVGNSMKSLLDSGALNKGQSVTFTTKDGKVVTGTLNDDGSVTTSDGKTYKNVYRTYDGTYKTTENYQTPEPPKQEPPKEETPVPEAPKLTEDIKKGVSAAIWNGGYGWGYDPEREERLKEVFGENDIQKNYVNKNVMSGYSGNLSDYSYSNMKKKFKQYKTGGLADFTGPAWLDGTKSKPEYILNADQTKAFFNLVDVLEGLSSGKVQNTQNTGDNIYDIDINVESIGSDYDVEQVASTIKRMINDDARYRNNNAINLQR